MAVGHGQGPAFNGVCESSVRKASILLRIHKGKKPRKERSAHLVVPMRNARTALNLGLATRSHTHTSHEPMISAISKEIREGRLREEPEPPGARAGNKTQPASRKE